MGRNLAPRETPPLTTHPPHTTGNPLWRTNTPKNSPRRRQKRPGHSVPTDVRQDSASLPVEPGPIEYSAATQIPHADHLPMRHGSTAESDPGRGPARRGNGIAARHCGSE